MTAEKVAMIQRIISRSERLSAPLIKWAIVFISSRVCNILLSYIKVPAVSGHFLCRPRKHFRQALADL